MRKEITTANDVILRVDKETPAILVLAKSGYGKNMLSESIEQAMMERWNAKIFIVDTKDILEPAYRQFPPTSFQRSMIRHTRGEKYITSYEVRISHPMTRMGIPSRALPEMNLYTIPLKALGEEEINIIMDNFGAKVSNALIMNTLAGLDRTETFFDFLQVLVEKTKKRQEPAFTELSEGKSYHAGIIKSKFSLFAEYGILAPENYSYNLDIERMLKQPDIVEVFSTRFVKDKKIRDLLVMYLMKELRKYAIKYRRPTVLVLDELADLCPAKSENYKKVLSNFIGTFLKTMRNMNISVIGLAQDINDIYETVQNGFTQICLGALSSGNARKYYAERFGLSKGELDLLMQAPRGTFIAIGIETKKLIMINH